MGTKSEKRNQKRRAEQLQKELVANERKIKNLYWEGLARAKQRGEEAVKSYLEKVSGILDQRDKRIRDVIDEEQKQRQRFQIVK